MSESKRTTRSSAADKATSATTPGTRCISTYLKKAGGVGDAWCDGVLHCNETGQYQTLKKMTKMFPGMLPASLSKDERARFSNDWSRTILAELKKEEGNERRARLIKEARAAKQVHLSLEVDELGDEVEALGGKVETIDGEVKTQGTQIKDLKQRVGILEEQLARSAQRPPTRGTSGAVAGGNGGTTEAPADLVQPSTDKKPSADRGFVATEAPADLVLPSTDKKPSADRGFVGDDSPYAGGNGGTAEAPADLVPPSTDKKPSARPSPKRLFVTAGGTGSGANVGGSFDAHDSVVANTGVLKAAHVASALVFPSISFADTSPAPLKDLKEWASKRRLASGSKVNAGAVINLLRPYVKDPGINSTMRRGKATKHDENYVQSISIALTAIKPFPFAKCCVYRGMNAKTPEAVLKFKSLMEQGELFVEPGLFSASALYPLPNSFQNMNTHFAIRSKSGRLIQAFSNRKDEWEVLFAAGTSFRILSFEDTNLAGWGRYKIVMEEVTSPIGGLTE